jgi:hypothetical protein
MIDFVTMLAGLALSWAFGVAVVFAVYLRSHERPPQSWIVGTGWLVGIFGTTLLMRGLSAAGVRWSVASIGLPLLIAVLIGAWLARRRVRELASGLPGRVTAALAGAHLSGWQRTAWRLLVVWITIRFALLFAEVWWLPLYPWDAWTQWGTKARVWYELGRIVPFVSVGEWLAAVPPNAYLDAAPHYPGTVPLFQVWSAVLIGRWDDALVNLPWWLTGVAFCVAFYGALRRLAFAPLPALVGASIVMSLPILNVHIALAGYADLPLAVYLTLGTVCAVVAVRTKSPADAALAVVLLAACVLIKNPGKAWLVVLLPGLVVAAMPRRGLQLAGAAFGAAALAILWLARSGVNVLGYQLSPQFAMPWNALFDAYFSFGNWNLLWYCAVATVALAWRQLLSREVAPWTSLIAAGLMFLFVGFAFTNAGAWVEDQSTVNRATLHLAPLVVVWMFVALRAWRRAIDAREVPPPSLGQPRTA